MTLERKIQAEIIAWVKKQDRCWICKYQAGPYSGTGIPDLLLCVAGRFVALEVKQKSGRVTPIQREVMRTMTLAGAICEVVHSLSEAKEVVNEQLRRNDSA